MNFFDWSQLATYTGALSMVGIITEMTKGITLVKKIPTQIWSYIIALAIMYLAYYFTGKLTPSNAFLIPFNSSIISLASNGGFEGLKRLIMEKKDRDENNL